MAREKQGSPRQGSSSNTPDPIGSALRKMWADVENEQVPDQFLDLLDAIDAKRNSAPQGEE